MTHPTQADWDCRTVPGVARRPKCGLKHCASCSPHTADRGTDRTRQLEQALSFYANPANWQAAMGIPAAREDAGEIAREVLGVDHD